MEARLVHITKDQLTRRRNELLAMLPFDEDELIRRVEDHTASPDERETYAELDEINFLVRGV